MSPKEIRRDGETHLRIVWADGRESLYSFEDLRRACPCATCNEMRDPLHREALLPEEIGRGINAMEIGLVGRYALRFLWSDGHKTGIYNFDYLEELDRTKLKIAN